LPNLTLSLHHARQLQLQSLGLFNPPSKRATLNRFVKSIEAMKQLQIDTISVVNRSPYLVMYARLGHYPTVWLEQALEQKKIFEVWSHEACFAPVKEMAFLRAQLLDRKHWSQRSLQKSLAEHGPQMKALLQSIHKTGPVKSSDFERQNKVQNKRSQLNPTDNAKPNSEASGWWNWKPEKRWLEAWFAAGHLMVARRDGFQRVYEIAARLYPHLAQENALTTSDPTSLRQYFALESIEALGVCKLSWLHDYYRLPVRFTLAEIEPLLNDKQLYLVEIPELETSGKYDPWLMSKSAKQRLKTLAGNARNFAHAGANYTVPLSPFDPLVWHRARAETLFNFEYRIECYTPEAKRKYGYFTLPILHNGHLIGRLDAKAHRQQQHFELKALHLEPSCVLGESDLEQLAQSFARFAHWHQCNQVSVQRVANAKGNDQKKTARFLQEKTRAALNLVIC
jgi:uncharacterized protein